MVKGSKGSFVVNAGDRWSDFAGNNYCLNPTFEADRVGQTTLTGWKLDKADANNINSTSKKRTGRWGLYLTDSKSLTQTLTVPRISTR
jgi:hypothetical protein